MRFWHRFFGEQVPEIVAALSTTLDARVDLIDAGEGLHHFSLHDGRGSSGQVDDVPLPGTCTVRISISDRWMLRVLRQGSLHHDAKSIAAWAAGKLAKLLPESEQSDPTYPPARGGGGTSGSAELGIPLSWVRRTQN